MGFKLNVKNKTVTVGLYNLAFPYTCYFFLSVSYHPTLSTCLLSYSFKKLSLGGGGLVTKYCLTLATPWIIVHQAPLSVGIPRQEYWSGSPFPSPGDLSNPGIEHRSTVLQEISCIASDFLLGFPGGSAGKESTCNVRDLGLIPGRSPGEGISYPLQYSGLEKSMYCIVHGVTKSRTQLSNFYFHFLY